MSIDLELLIKGLTVVIQLGLILAPVFVAFYKRDKDAMAMLLEAVPRLYDVVAQERRKAEHSRAITDPLGRGLDLAQELTSRRLTGRRRALVQRSLQAEHERRRGSISLAGSSPAVPVVPPRRS